jgi:hypothetical protein
VRAARCGDSLLLARSLAALLLCAVPGGRAWSNAQVTRGQLAGWQGESRMLRRSKGRQRDQSRTTPSGAAGPAAVFGLCKKAQSSKARRWIGFDVVMSLSHARALALCLSLSLSLSPLAVVDGRTAEGERRWCRCRCRSGRRSYRDGGLGEWIQEYSMVLASRSGWY